MENDGIWSFRWTGSGDISWDAHWEGVATLQVRVPIIREIAPGFALSCSLELDWQRQAVRMDRGEMVAEFDVSGFTSGRITLLMPCTGGPARGGPAWPRDARGLAVLASQSPRSDHGSGPIAVGPPSTEAQVAT